MGSLITRVDEFTEPRIEKIRPIVEPRIEQVKEIATPYADSGINRYESIRKEGDKKWTSIMEYKNTKVETVQKIKDAKISWCKKMLSKKGDQVNQLFRVPATDNVEGLKFQGVLGMMAATCCHACFCWRYLSRPALCMLPRPSARSRCSQPRRSARRPNVTSRARSLITSQPAKRSSKPLPIPR